MALELARTRGKKLCSVDKANVLETTEMWREEVQKLRDADYTDIALSHMYVDNAAMQLVRNPQTVRRDRHRQYFWRYSVRLRRYAHRFARHAAIRLLGAEKNGKRAAPLYEPVQWLPHRDIESLASPTLSPLFFPPR